VQETEVAQTQWIRAEGEPMPLAELRAWDWRAELDRQDRGMTWLARKTERSVSAVYRYSDGSLTPPESWLRDVARLLGVDVAE
jgi:ribosome-binding protein aMBF1 (putative translation factor)